MITPEWYHSDSIKVTDSNQMNWGNLGECDLIQAIADSLEKAKNPSSVVGIEFERSFCSRYQSYHYRPREKWGIHMRYDSLIRITSLFYHNCPAIARKLDAAKSAFLYLFIHELFHHILENAVSIIEIISGESHLYTKYYTDVYEQVFNSSYCIEEALGNSLILSMGQKMSHQQRLSKERTAKARSWIQRFHSLHRYKFH